MRLMLLLLFCSIPVILLYKGGAPWYFALLFGGLFDLFWIVVAILTNRGSSGQRAQRPGYIGDIPIAAIDQRQQQTGKDRP
jgi:hypothetical protein